MITEEEKEFEEARRCLLDSYYSNIQNHAAYLIALIVGGIALIYSWKAFSYSIITEIIFWLLMLGIVLVSLYFVLRVLYYTMFVNCALTLSYSEVNWYVRDRNWKLRERKPEELEYIKKLPHTQMLNLTILHSLYEIKRGEKGGAKMGVFQTIALSLSRNKDPDEVSNNQNKISHYMHKNTLLASILVIGIGIVLVIFWYIGFSLLPIGAVLIGVGVFGIVITRIMEYFKKGEIRKISATT